MPSLLQLLSAFCCVFFLSTGQADVLPDHDVKESQEDLLFEEDREAQATAEWRAVYVEVKGEINDDIELWGVGLGLRFPISSSAAKPAHGDLDIALSLLGVNNLKRGDDDFSALVVSFGYGRKGIVSPYYELGIDIGEIIFCDENKNDEATTSNTPDLNFALGMRYTPIDSLRLTAYLNAHYFDGDNFKTLTTLAPGLRVTVDF